MKAILTILAATFSLAAFAQELPAFEEVDQNSDGMISQTEASAVEQIDFAALDTNKNGSIDRQEYEQHS
jgi:Ca2+-binding EF-hand superfamily protein